MKKKIWLVLTVVCVLIAIAAGVYFYFQKASADVTVSSAPAKAPNAMEIRASKNDTLEEIEAKINQEINLKSGQRQIKPAAEEIFEDRIITVVDEDGEPLSKYTSSQQIQTRQVTQPKFIFKEGIPADSQHLYYENYTKLVDLYGEPSINAPIYIQAVDSGAFADLHGNGIRISSSYFYDQSTIIHELAHLFHGANYTLPPILEEGMATELGIVAYPESRLKPYRAFGDSVNKLSRNVSIDFINGATMRGTNFQPYILGTDIFSKIYLEDPQAFKKINTVLYGGEKIGYEATAQNYYNATKAIASAVAKVENVPTDLWLASKPYYSSGKNSYYVSDLVKKTDGIILTTKLPRVSAVSSGGQPGSPGSPGVPNSSIKPEVISIYGFNRNALAQKTCAETCYFSFKDFPALRDLSVYKTYFKTDTGGIEQYFSTGNSNIIFYSDKSLATYSSAFITNLGSGQKINLTPAEQINSSSDFMNSRGRYRITLRTNSSTVQSFYFNKVITGPVSLYIPTQASNCSPRLSSSATNSLLTIIAQSNPACYSKVLFDGGLSYASAYPIASGQTYSYKLYTRQDNRLMKILTRSYVAQ